MWTNKFRRIISFVMALAILFSWLPVEAVETEQEAADSIVSTNALLGKTLSILGDSISTFSNYSNGTAAQTTNSTIAGGAIYYPRSGFDVTAESTWWYQAAQELGMEILVNNSWSGSCLLNERSGTVGAYVDRCVQLHDDTGDNAGQKPDIIAIFLGTNDYYTYPGTLGSYEDIDFDGLIHSGEEGFTYAEPTTSLEAYAITLHKISQAYPDAEVYCFTLLPRVNSTNQPTAFNEDICQLAEYFGVHTVDLYDCGIQSESTAFYMLMGDSLHPDTPGMDAMTNAFVSAVLKNSGLATHDVTFALEGAVVMEGTSRTVVSGGAFEATLAPLDASLPLEVTVTMGGADVTASCLTGNVVAIPAVTGNVTITAKPGQREPMNFRWETQADTLVSVNTDGNTENPLTMTHGSITDGTFAKTRFTLTDTVMLNHDRPWSLEWKASGTWTDTTDGALLFAQANASATENCAYLYRRHQNTWFALGICENGKYHNYAANIAGTGIDTTEEHVYRLTNRIADDGSNMVYLYVDDVEIGPMNQYYIGGTYQNKTVDWVCGKDFRFSYMGTTPHTIGGGTLTYVQVWENGIPCSHSYTAQVTLPTCTEQGYTDYTCSVCGDSYRTPWLDETAYEGKTIACVGDSITAAYGVTKDETDYVTLLAQQLGMDYIRLGASGTTLCTDGSRTCNIGKLTEANLNGADVVTIAMGINDFCAAGAGYYELGNIDSTDTSTIYGAARMWCERIAELRKTESLSDTQFYFVTPVICSWNNSVTSNRDWDQSKTNIHGYTLRDLCNAIMEVAALYDVAVIDLNLLSGMYYVDATDNNTAEFGGDGVHPGEKGHEMMADALANALLQNNLRNDHEHTFGSWITTTWPSCCAGEQKRICTVCSAAESRTAEPNGSHRYDAVVTAPTYTQQGYTTYTCTVCGDSYVDDYTNPTAPNSYRWEMQDNTMVSATTGGNTANALTLDSGSITDGTFTSVRYTLQSEVRLSHNLPWVIEWRSSGNWDGMLFGSTMDSSTQGLTYLFRYAAMDFLAFGEYTGTWNNYGVVHSIDMTVSHVFRLENRIASDGSNAVYLLVDGQEIDVMHHYYVGGTNKNQTVNWANGKDIVFANMGTTSHPVNGMKLDYLQVWEKGHEHAYIPVVTAPTCTEQGYTTYSCACGDSYVDEYVDAAGHLYEKGICSRCSSPASPYLQQLPESITGCSNLYDILTPTKGYYTATQYDTSNGAVLSVVIPVEPGDRIAASSFGPVSENMGSVNGIRVTYLLDGIIVQSLSASSVYTTYTQNGYLTVPEGVNMVSVPWWAPSDSNWLTLGQISKNFATHSPRSAPAQAPTCTEKGYTAGEICEVCNASLGTRVEIPATGHDYSGNTCTICGTVNDLAFLDGKYVSILGDSISTFNGYSNDATVNSTIGGNGHRYDAGTADTKPGSYCLLESVDHTWWMHFANRSGMKLLVNNSWAGSQVFGGQTGDGRVIPAAYLERCINLHDNTIDNNPGNAPINPDVIFVYLGINDYNFNRSNVGNGAVDYAKLVSSDGTYVTPTTFGEAYGILLHKMRSAYPDAQIFAMTLLPENLYSVDIAAWAQHNAYIRAAAEYYGVPLVDLAEDCAITWDNYSGYMIDKIHPTTAGMELISDCIEAELLAYYKENPPHVHTPVIDPAVEATCTETGLTEGSHCETCGEVLVAQNEVPVSGHSYTNGICTGCGVRQTSTFEILDTRCNIMETFTYEVGMTWREWLNSKYNTGMGSCIAIWVSEGPNILSGNPNMDICVNGNPVDYDDVICEQDDLQLIRYG